MKKQEIIEKYKLKIEETSNFIDTIIDQDKINNAIHRINIYRQFIRNLENIENE